ncbi:hypothetical protein GW17_00026035 [Ensete ventricosum]|nr:hypothetical protein GW17_00026035 [Ensete ventricosum]
MQCWPPTIRSRPRASARGRPAVARASPQGRPTPLTRAAAAHGHTRLQRGARKGGRLQDARKGLVPAASPAASRDGGADRRGRRPLAGWLPTGKDSRRLRRGSSDGDDDADGARGVRASF